MHLNGLSLTISLGIVSTIIVGCSVEPFSKFPLEKTHKFHVFVKCDYKRNYMKYHYLSKEQ